ncbi:MAG: MBL fold metallo-hydrolase, partial [Mediterraneibacter gnavus]
YVFADAKFLEDGASLALAGYQIRMISTPGHTAGGCCYYIEEEKVLFSGDTLFAGSVGRTDFPTGSMSTLVRSVKERLLSLPEDTQVYPGHMEATTIGFEKENNPFL